MNLEDVEACWSAVQDDVWHEDNVLKGVLSDEAVQDTFATYGGSLYRVYITIIRLLIDTQCSNSIHSHFISTYIILYQLRMSICPQ